MPIDRTKTTFWFDGVSSEDLGIVVMGFPTFNGAEPKVTKYSIPGRNGDLTYWDGSYKNVNAELKCFVIDAEKVEAALTAVNNWMADCGYRKFVISSELGRYRMARITNAAEIAITMGVLAPFTIKLDCKPQRFYEDDEMESFGLSGVIHNQTKFTAKPLLHCLWATGAGKAGTEEIKFINSDGEHRLLLHAIKTTPEWVDIDLESRSAITSKGENVSLYFESNYLQLPPGDTSFTLSNSLTGTNWFSGVEILPRWWTL